MHSVPATVTAITSCMHDALAGSQSLREVGSHRQDRNGAPEHCRENSCILVFELCSIFVFHTNFLLPITISHGHSQIELYDNV
jgi:hypothetical protein